MFKKYRRQVLMDLLAHLDPPGFGSFARLARWFGFGFGLRPFRWTPCSPLRRGPFGLGLGLWLWAARLAGLATAATRLAPLGTFGSLARLARWLRFGLGFGLGPCRWTPWLGLTPA